MAVAAVSSCVAAVAVVALGTSLLPVLLLLLRLLLLVLPLLLPVLLLLLPLLLCDDSYAAHLTFELLHVAGADTDAGEDDFAVRILYQNTCVTHTSSVGGGGGGGGGWAHQIVQILT